MKNKAIFLDRDGTINVEKDYLYKIEDFEFIDGVVESLKIFSELGYKIIVLTNQSGIARGYYKEEDVERLHDYLKDYLKEKNIIIDEFYYCPHHKDKGIGKYKIDCNCRKPKTGMFDLVIKDYDIDKSLSYMVGDKISDVKAGLNAGVKSILVKTGHGKEEAKNMDIEEVKIYEKLLDFALDLKNNKL